jgi:hypothetical protein
MTTSDEEKVQVLATFFTSVFTQEPTGDLPTLPCIHIEHAKEARKNSKAIWQYIKSKSKTKDGVSELNTDPSNPKSPMTTSDEEKAQVLATFFTSVFTQEPPGDLPTLPRIHIEHAMEGLTISEETVEKTLNKLKPSKSPGPDCLHPRFLKELASHICVPLATIFQTSLRTKTLPEEWKQGRISAIFKKGNKKLASNYRPVRRMSIVCKSMEHIL